MEVNSSRAKPLFVETMFNGFGIKFSCDKSVFGKFILRSEQEALITNNNRGIIYLIDIYFFEFIIFKFFICFFFLLIMVTMFLLSMPCLEIEIRVKIKLI